MRLSGLLPLINTTSSVAALQQQLVAASARFTVGVADAAKPALLAAVLASSCEPVLIVTPRPDRAAALVEEMSLFLPDEGRLLLFPEIDIIPYEHVTPDVEAAEERLRVLQRLGSGSVGAPIVVTSGMALAQRTLAPAARRAAVIDVTTGSRLPLAALMGRLQSMGYDIVSLVEAPGEVSRRGGIVDVWPPASSLPLRIELYGEEVETLRSFDPTTQRTVALAPSAELGPAREASGERTAIDTLLARLDPAAMSDEARQRFEDEAQRLRDGDLSAGGDFYLPFLAQASLLDYFPNDGLVVVDETADLTHALDEIDAQAEDARGDLERRGLIPAGLPLPHVERSRVMAEIEQRRRLVDLHRWGSADSPALFAVPFEPPKSYGGRLRMVMHDVLDLVRQGQHVVVTSQQSARLAELFASEGRSTAALEDLESPPGAGELRLVHGSVGNGWSIELPDGRLQLITDTELFGFTKQRRPQRTRGGNRDAFLADLTPGDHVVHIEHGIAVFNGLLRRSTDGIDREYLELRYADGDRLLVPTDQVDRVTRFVGPSDRTPTLSRLGTMEWTRIKERVRRAVTDLAQELLELYAARELLPGHAFPLDQPWQQELEASFPYVETGDQLRTIQEVKADMESSRPMDRVIVGDVGYGKTEVAIRAAFKAALDDTQVAVLVPTTVLAQQHLQTFRDRLSGFPTRVEVVSRFRSDREIRDVLDALSHGAVDILIGTHRLLQKDVVFKNLGLVVIDEEQRFGVAHKERLKAMRQQVDVLTLSATPIPRTLHMSLSGIRDMSTITTAPEDRHPIKTYVAEFDDRIVREAILREVDRGGQVYFVHNRVNNIERIAEDLRRIVPEVEVCVGHGQMPEDQLEKVMIDFQRGQYDVLVCTTIIESGLDIPTVNTIVINQADRLGLSQLYQLRGRVGRGANRAYAYLLYDRNRALSEVAQKRLQTIFEATELGAGFQIALRDLEIRGAGNLLGSEQSGHIGAVGFDLYSRMLGDAVNRLRAASRGEEPPVPSSALPAVQLDLPLAAYVPESYVVDLNVRLALYQRMGQLVTPEEAATFAEEMEDRFGRLPPAATNLLYVLSLKALAREAGLQSILREDGVFVLRQAGPIADRAALARRFTQHVQVGTTQIRVDAALGWPALLYAIAAMLCGRESTALPEFAAGVSSQGTASPQDGGAPSAGSIWQRPSKSLPSPAREASSGRFPTVNNRAGSAQSAARKLPRGRR